MRCSLTTILLTVLCFSFPREGKSEGAFSRVKITFFTASTVTPREFSTKGIFVRGYCIDPNDNFTNAQWRLIRVDDPIFGSYVDFYVPEDANPTSWHVGLYKSANGELASKSGDFTLRKVRDPATNQAVYVTRTFQNNKVTGVCYVWN